MADAFLQLAPGFGPHPDAAGVHVGHLIIPGIGESADEVAAVIDELDIKLNAAKMRAEYTPAQQVAHPDVWEETEAPCHWSVYVDVSLADDNRPDLELAAILLLVGLKVINSVDPGGEVLELMVEQLVSGEKAPILNRNRELVSLSCWVDGNSRPAPAVRAE